MDEKPMLLGRYLIPLTAAVVSFGEYLKTTPERFHYWHFRSYEWVCMAEAVLLVYTFCAIIYVAFVAMQRRSEPEHIGANEQELQTKTKHN